MKHHNRGLSLIALASVCFYAGLAEAKDGQSAGVIPVTELTTTLDGKDLVVQSFQEAGYTIERQGKAAKYVRPGKKIAKNPVSHVRVQSEVDRMAAAGTLPEPASPEFVQWLHLEFYRGAPAPMLHITGVGREFTMTPGEWRSRPAHDVAVGRHQPPSSARVDDFMRYFGQRYRFDGMGRAGRIIAMAAAHHRLNYIHPFPDGNGRVSRLMSHAMAWRADVASHGLWSISRGLARGRESRTEYKQMMDLADTPRQGDFDGRGNLSERALIEFVTWFVRVALDQVTFMSELFDLDNLANRLRTFLARHERFRPEAAALLEQTLVRGEIERGEASRITGLPVRTAQRLLNDLVGEGLLASATPKGPVSLRFPAASLEALFPRLYPLA